VAKVRFFVIAHSSFLNHDSPFRIIFVFLPRKLFAIMIPRYSRPEMSAVWTEENKFGAYLKVEIEAAAAWSKLGVIPAEDVEKLRTKATFDVQRIYEIEKETRHDIVAFTRAVSESLGDEKKWVHYGLTSTDVVDTANGYLIKQANNILRKDLQRFSDILKKRAYEFKDTPCIGRTHGVHADITALGLKWALWFEEMRRNIERFEMAAADVECGKISGAVGNFANTPPFVQDYVCEQLGIHSARISTQVLQRDRHAHYMGTLALIASTMEQMAIEVRHWQRTELREAEEAFGKGQKGSSAMPHKRNPIGSENMCGCARILRGYMVSSYENIPLWHERDISHSSAERIMLPDATILLDYMLNRFGNILENLVVFPENMLKNIYLTHKVIFAQRVMTALINKGFSREKAYDLVQPIAMKAWFEALDYKELLLQNPEVMAQFTSEELDQCFTLEYYLKQVPAIFERVFGE
jgi:adenylosuccinate lyase